MFQVRHQHHPLLRWVLLGARPDDPVTQVRKLVQINLGAWLLLLHIVLYNAWFMAGGVPGLMRSGWAQLPVGLLAPLVFWLQLRRRPDAARWLLMVLGPADAMAAMVGGQGTATGVHGYLLLFALLLPSLTQARHGLRSGAVSASLVLAFLWLSHVGWPSHHSVALMPPEQLLPLRATILLSCVACLWCAAMLTELAAAQNEQRLQELADTDVLTGLPNRRRWAAELAREARRARRSGAPMVVGVLDLDHFKRVNDNFGHAAGDRALVHACTVIGAELRASDVLARTGGEEFSLLLPGTHLAEARAVAERIRQALEERPLEQGARWLPLTVSIGLALVNDPTDLDTPLQQADEATYRAKREGRNRVCVAEA